MILSTGFYCFKAKFDIKTYTEWILNLFSLLDDETNNFKLVFYTDTQSYNQLCEVEPKIREYLIFEASHQIPHQTTRETYQNKIRLVIREIKDFYMYKYSKKWIKNQILPDNELKDTINWKVNMLWSEKLWFVKDTIDNKYFGEGADGVNGANSAEECYGWCDSGYFRNRIIDLNTNDIHNFPNSELMEKMKQEHKNQIFYGLLRNDNDILENISIFTNMKNSETGLPYYPIPQNINLIAGGFFLIYSQKISWWCNLYEECLLRYFENNAVVKDDQIIIVNCIFGDNNKSHFKLIQDDEKYSNIYDKWFLFQRFLSQNNV